MKRIKLQLKYRQCDVDLLAQIKEENGFRTLGEAQEFLCNFYRQTALNNSPSPVVER